MRLIGSGGLPLAGWLLATVCGVGAAGGAPLAAPLLSPVQQGSRSVLMPGLRVGGGAAVRLERQVHAACRVPTALSAYLKAAPLHPGQSGVARCTARETFTWAGTVQRSTRPAVLAVAQFRRDVSRTDRALWEARTDASSGAFGVSYRGRYYFVTVDNAQYDTTMVVTRSTATRH